MTVLAVYGEGDGGAPTFVSTDPDRIRDALAAIGVGFERWSTNAKVTGGDPPESILSAYASWIDDLKRRGGYVTSDVISLTPQHPDARALRKKFLDEHTHAEDEVRFFVAGRGAFYLHVAQRVHAIVCERGDLLRVPANTKHWFDTGPAPDLVAIRVFTNPSGWVAQYTGDAIAERFPRLEPGGLPSG